MLVGVLLSMRCKLDVCGFQVVFVICSTLSVPFVSAVGVMPPRWSFPIDCWANMTSTCCWALSIDVRVVVPVSASCALASPDCGDARLIVAGLWEAGVDLCALLFRLSGSCFSFTNSAGSCVISLYVALSQHAQK